MTAFSIGTAKLLFSFMLRLLCLSERDIAQLGPRYRRSDELTLFQLQRPGISVVGLCTGTVP